MRNKIIYLLVVITGVAALLLYFSPANRIERSYAAMMESGVLDLGILEAYIQRHEAMNNVQYNRALNQAALLDDGYLLKVVEHYADGSFILFADTAERILSKLPSESIKFNLVAGRIYETDEFGLQNVNKAAYYLSYAALRGNGPAAKHLANVYLKANCPVEAATWAKVVNASDDVSPCGTLPVDVNKFSDAEWNSVLVNSDKILESRATGEIPRIEFHSTCSIINEP